jgi:hypothetical protein
MVKSAATPRVSNQGATMGNHDSTWLEKPFGPTYPILNLL